MPRKMPSTFERTKSALFTWREPSKTSIRSSISSVICSKSSDLTIYGQKLLEKKWIQRNYSGTLKNLGNLNQHIEGIKKASDNLKKDEDTSSPILIKNQVWTATVTAKWKREHLITSEIF